MQPTAGDSAKQDGTQRTRRQVKPGIGVEVEKMKEENGTCAEKQKLHGGASVPLVIVELVGTATSETLAPPCKQRDRCNDHQQQFALPENLAVLRNIRS